MAKSVIELPLYDKKIFPVDEDLNVTLGDLYIRALDKVPSLQPNSLLNFATNEEIEKWVK